VKIKVKHCMLSPRHKARFEANVGDSVLLIDINNKYYSATINFIISKDIITVSFEVSDKIKIIEVTTDSIQALILGD